MMRDFMALILQWWALFFGGIIAVGVLLYIAHRIIGKLKNLFRRLALFVVALVAGIYGGTKNITNRFTADSGLAVVNAEISIPTNGVGSSTMSITWAGPDTPTPIYVRNGNGENWQNLNDWTWEPDGVWWWQRSFENGTNTISAMTAGSYAAATNVTVWAQWHLGTDLPPVEIDGDGVTIEQFGATSGHVTIRYAVKATVLTGGSGVFTISVQRADNIWIELYRETVTGGVTNSVTFPGFWVGETTRWRARLEVGE